jgi:hypothetical protein
MSLPLQPQTTAVPVIGEHLREAPYMGVLFVLLTAACLIVAVAALVWDPAAVYAFASELAAVACAVGALRGAAARRRA